MPEIGVYHPQLVHFVIALLFVGVAARVLSFLPLGTRGTWLGPMAATLILMGSVAALGAYESGMQSHGPVERVPGAREAVQNHEKWGQRTRNLFVVVALLEMAGLTFASQAGLARTARALSAAAGLAGLFVLYEAAEHGGKLVYAYAGGVGIRSGEAADVRRLLVAGLYHNIQAARDSGRKDEAARLTDELIRQMPGDAGVRFLGVESLIRDRDDAQAALAAMAAMDIPADDRRLQMRKAMLTVQAYRAAGLADSAEAAIAALRQRYPNDPRVEAAIERMTGGPGAR